MVSPGSVARLLAFLLIGFGLTGSLTVLFALWLAEQSRHRHVRTRLGVLGFAAGCAATALISGAMGSVGVRVVAFIHLFAFTVGAGVTFCTWHLLKACDI